MGTISGIHHVTAITADVQKNIDFYCGVLGLRLVKLTVNFDDPGSYHLYYGDEIGHPGTIMTFFGWPGGVRGHVGPPQITSVAFEVPEGALPYWVSRFDQLGVHQEDIQMRLGDELIRAVDPDGMSIEIVDTKQAASRGNVRTGSIPRDQAIIGFHSVTISEEGYENTAKLLTEVMGFKELNSEANRFRYRASHGGSASTVDLICTPDARRGSGGAGVVHHVAFRTPNDSEQVQWRKDLVEAGYNVTPVIDRNYFHSIYYREPGGVLFEIATDPPGFTVDETKDDLGTGLKLPAQYESHRSELAAILPKVTLPQWVSD